MVGGGADEEPEPAAMTVYNMATRSLEERRQPPLPLNFCSGVSCGGHVYSVGGLHARGHIEASSVHAYVPDIDAWFPAPFLPTPLYGVAVAEHAGGIYACGGWALTAAEGTWRSSADVVMLDTRSRAWFALPSMPSPAAYAQAVAVGGRIYVPGGRMGEARVFMRLACLQCYDVVAGRWDTGCAPMAAARCSSGVAAMGGEVWAVGGYCDSGEAGAFLSSVERYSPGSNSWSPGVPLPIACGSGCCMVVEH